MVNGKAATPARSDAVYVFTKGGYGSTLGVLLRCFDCEIRRRIKLLSYDQLFRIPSYPAGAFVFTDFDRLDETLLEAVRAFARYVAAERPGFPILNNPDRVLGRFDILNLLPPKDLGQTAAHKLPDWKDVDEFPVFIRYEDGHFKPLSGLLHSSEELENEVSRHLDDHGGEFGDIIIVKYLDYSDCAGVFRKYAAFRLGDCIYGEHVFHSRNWYVKLNDHEPNKAFYKEAQDYRVTNPHEELLRPYFKAAGIEFGRADYCLIDGKINLFEINTNPTFVADPPSKLDLFDRHAFAKFHSDRLMTLPSAEGPPLEVPARLRSGLTELSINAAHRQTMRIHVGPDILVRRFHILRETLRRVITGRARNAWG